MIELDSFDSRLFAGTMLWPDTIAKPRRHKAKIVDRRRLCDHDGCTFSAVRHETECETHEAASRAFGGAKQ